MTLLPQDVLTSATADLQVAIERELVERPGRPDLADVIARARAIDADAVPEGLHAVGEHGDEPEQLDPVLALFATALRDEVEDDVRERAMQPATPPVVEVARVRRRWAVALVAVAAAVVGVVSLARLQESPATLEADRGPGSLAAKSVEQLLEDGQWSRGVMPPVREVREVRVQPEPEPEPEPELEIVAEPKPAIAPTKPRPSLTQLEREAAEAWRAGHLTVAESKLRKIIARAGRGPKAELAYGDLFAVTKQRGGSARQTGAWKQYLKRFPQGRFADDARAGLCMRASKDAAPGCWSDYLQKHPKGTHAARARRELARDEAP